MTMTSVQVLPGPGIVARFGDVLLWLEEGRAGGGQVTARLLDLARELADRGDGRGAGPRVAEVLRQSPEAVPAMVLVAPTTDGLQAIVHGWGRVLADGVDIDGGWADRELAWTTALAAGRGGDLLRVPTPGSVLDLRRGSTPGGGAAVALAAREVAPEPEPGPSFELIDLRATPPRREPLPVGGPVAPTSGVTVKGIVCGRGHFNDPVALSCSTCGISIAQDTRILQDGIRPSLGTLVLDDGTAFGLDADHLVGSAPQPESEVTGAGVRPVPVTDPTAQVAPVHAEVRLVDWDVVLVARAPTLVLAAGGQQWSPAPPGQPTPLPAGATVAVGQRTFVVESNPKSSGG